MGGPEPTPGPGPGPYPSAPPDRDRVPRPRPTVWTATALVMVAFAANSVLARVALRGAGLEGAAGFTLVRLAAGAATLVVVAAVRRRGLEGDWASAAALFAYAAAFSAAYVSLAAGTGALVLFGAVQATMVGAGLARGERLSAVQWTGLAVAFAGLVVLVAPGLEAPPPVPAALMAVAGVAWGVYSLRGRRAGDPGAATAGNFVRASGIAAAIAAALVASGRGLEAGAWGYAVASGALTSGLGYLAWYAVLPSLRAATAATVQLSVPALAALGGAAFLAEPLTARLVLATAVTLGGIALVVRYRAATASANRPAEPGANGK